MKTKKTNKQRKKNKTKKIKKVGINQADKSKVEIVSTLGTVIHNYLLSCCYGYTQIINTCSLIASL